MFSIDPHLLERRIAEHIHGTSVVNQNLVCVIVSYSDAHNECVVIRVVKASSIFFRETNNWVIDLWHFWDDACQLNVLNHSKESLSSLLGRAGGRRSSHDHSYVS